MLLWQPFTKTIHKHEWNKTKATNLLSERRGTPEVLMGKKQVSFNQCLIIS